MEEEKKKSKSHPKERKKLYNILTFARRADVVAALKVLRGKIKEGDRQAAQYLLDQTCGTAIQRQELRNGDGEAFRIVMYMPEKVPLGK